MRIFRLLMSILFACVVACRSTNVDPSKSLRGRVVDPAGSPVAGVQVRLAGRNVARTDRYGAFVIRCLPRNDRLAVSFSAPKFMSTTRIYEARSSSDGNVVIMWPRATPARVRASEGGKLEFSGGTIRFPPNAFVDAKGRSVTGEVSVSMSVLDVTDPRQLASVPGDFTARMRDSSIRNLETFGLFELVISDGDGRRVDLARDRAASVELNVPKGRREVPQSVGSFSFDEESGRWVQRAPTWRRQLSTLSTQLTDGSSGGGGTPIGAPSSVWWNADQPLETTCMRVEVRGCKHCNNDTIVTTAIVRAHGKDYTGTITHDKTINNGVACLFVKKSAQVILQVIDAQTAYNVEVETPSNVASVCDATCDLVVTHAVGAPLNNAPLNSGWCATDGANTSPFNTLFSSAIANTSATASNVTLTIAPCTSNCSGKGYVSGEYKTDCFHGYGTYKATIDPPQKPTTGSIEGLVTGFFTFTDSSDGTAGPNVANWHDEVDIELVGRDANGGDYKPGATNQGGCSTTDLVVHTNYFTKKPWQLPNQRDYCIPNGVHDYEFDWTATKIEWRYDGIVLRTVMRTNDDWPTQPGRLYLNLWGTDGTQDGLFAGANAYNFATSRTATFSNISTP